MKIEKLTDTNPQKVLTKHNQYATMSQSAGNAADFWVVTKISQGVKNPNRANIFINNKFDFSLNIAQLAEAKLKIGQTLSGPELSQLRSLSSFGKLYQRTLEWTLLRPRSIQETRDYLRQKTQATSQILADEILQQLISKNYLNDEKFAKYYIENRFTKKGISQKRLVLELRKKGISQSIIDQALSSTPRPDHEEITKIISKKRQKYDNNKLIQYLVRQGFDYESAKTAVLETDSQN